MNYELQRYKLERHLKKGGVDSDKIDLFARIDRTLTFGENKRSITKNMGFGQEVRGRMSSYELYEKAKEVNAHRSKRALRQDDNRRAVRTFSQSSLTKRQYGKWRKQPNRYDIEGVDTRGGY
jgi:hypothetical protein